MLELGGDLKDEYCVTKTTRKMHEGQCNEKYEQKIHNARTWESSSPVKSK